MKMKFQLAITLLLFSCFASTAQNAYEVNFKDLNYEPVENITSFEPSDVSEAEIISNKFYRFIQFNRSLKNNEIKSLNAQGIRLLSYVPSFTYLASIPADISKVDLNSLNIRSIWRVDQKMKSSGDVQNKSLPSWSIKGGNALLLIKYYKDLDQEYIVQLLEKSKIEVISSNGVNNFLEISIPLDRLEELANLPYLESVEAVSSPGIKDDRRGRSLHRVNKLDPNRLGARNYTGKGINVVVRDDGPVFEHIDFKGRLDQTFVVESPVIRNHADRVTGVLGGAGNLNPINIGMAHESIIHILDYSSDFLDETMSLFENNDVIVTNSSYSDGCNGGYTSNTQIVDQQSYDNPTLMHVFSAGNNGEGQSIDGGPFFDCGYGASPVWGNITGGHKQGKNVIATANLDYRGNIMTSSSRGPAYDGRIKPDIAANGNNHVSTSGLGQDYIEFGGTSAASPVVAGVSAMLHEAFEMNHGTRANAALLKAIMLNTATDLGNKGPDFIYGWGSLNAYRAVLTIEENRFLNDVIQQDEQKTHTITIPENVAELRVMTYWPDPEVPIFSTRALLNDLNTELKSSTGDVSLPWVLDATPDPTILNLPATKGVDFLNNMEQIAIDNPSAGEYTLEVNGDLIPFGSNEYYVVWEFRMNEIDIIFPDGGENLNQVSSEVIHWDATGNEGDFIITHIDNDGNENQIGQAPGNVRLIQWFTPQKFSEKSKIRVSRNGLSDESTEPFLLANNPRNLELINNVDANEVWLHWSTDSIPISYNIYALGDTKMEKVLTLEADSFLIPNEPIFQYNWVAVSANFENGTEGKRSIAISTTPTPIVLITNNVNDKPCINTPVIFETQSTETLLEYNWQFGNNSIPEEAMTKGPHSVIYTKTGPNIAGLTITNEGGTDQKFFVLSIQDELESKATEITEEGGGEYTFKSKIAGAISYTWDFGDGNTGTGKTVSHIFTDSDTYTVTLEAENTCGIVTEINMVAIDLTNVEDLTEKDFAISPNPNQGNFEVTLPDLEGHSLNMQLISLDGKIIKTKYIDGAVPGQKVKWDVVTSGMYFMKFHVGQKEITRKIIVE